MVRIVAVFFFQDRVGCSSVLRAPAGVADDAVRTFGAPLIPEKHAIPLIRRFRRPRMLRQDSRTLSNTDSERSSIIWPCWGWSRSVSHAAVLITPLVTNRLLSTWPIAAPTTMAISCRFGWIGSACRCGSNLNFPAVKTEGTDISVERRSRRVRINWFRNREVVQPAASPETDFWGEYGSRVSNFATILRSCPREYYSRFISRAEGMQMALSPFWKSSVVFIGLSSPQPRMTR